MNILEKIIKNYRGFGKSHYHLGKNVVADWLVIVGVSVVIASVFIVLAFYRFSNYRQNDTAMTRAVSATSTAPLLDRAKLDSVLKYFENREKKFNEIKTAKPRLTEPSR